ncbi:NAD(P)H-binding protein [Dyadobacter flavalbus]|uniref:NAD(P)H-binding protein n=1 Tax=Dyadobacter flavalbus TaxID=2579942 RepID=A0A5M8QV08_9BACT|nr:NAD(P)H-binding protein [Dyadobacter flavalbus]KAA6438273.1 NAD(P)H-binding protein [Dyadobacter flavalbus]
MKIIITGSLGNISRPLTEALVQKGHAVTVISSKPEKQKDIEAMGATAAIGSLENEGFLAGTFADADAVYCMVPPNYTAPDQLAYYRLIGNCYAEAITQSGVKRVIHLSSYGAHLEKGSGIILGSHQVENILNAVPELDITHMRPGYFNYNLFSFIGMIKHAGMMAANYGGNDRIILVSPADIATAIADELETPVTGMKVRYVVSEELTGNEIAGILGEAIGKPDLKWEIISDEQMLNNLLSHGMPETLAGKMVEMFASIHSGALSEDYFRNKPAETGKVKLKDFAREFAAAFEQK